MPKNITDIETWLTDLEEGTLFRYGVYRRMFTPYEMQKAFSDESVYEDDHYSLCLIEDAVDLGGGEWLLGLRDVDYSGEIYQVKHYFKLSEIRLSYFDIDQQVELFEAKKEDCDEL